MLVQFFSHYSDAFRRRLSRRRLAIYFLIGFFFATGSSRRPSWSDEIRYACQYRSNKIITIIKPVMISSLYRVRVCVIYTRYIQVRFIIIFVRRMRSHEFCRGLAPRVYVARTTYICINIIHHGERARTIGIAVSAGQCDAAIAVYFPDARARAYLCVCMCVVGPRATSELS